jgi:predicted nuclease of predicted toxin-antitoxin system
MRLLANENFPKDAVDALRENGHDVFWVREEKPGINDQEVLRIAQSEKRLLVTFDKDFGELAFKERLNTAEIGIILFRIIPKSSAHIALVAVSALESRDDWQGHFSVVEEERIRMTELPPSDLDSDEIH